MPPETVLFPIATMHCLFLALALPPAAALHEPGHDPGADAAHHAPQQEVTLRTIPLRGGVHMILGRGGNLGVSVGASGAFLIDDQFAPLSEAILAEIAKLTDEPVRFLVNTHVHGDHVGGNANLARTGAVIVAHDNVRRRMNAEQMERELAQREPGALPVVTFTDRVTFHWNDDEIRVFHVEHAHTDGDAIIHFTRADVIHTGDVFFHGSYPFLDVDRGGSLDGMLAAVERVLELATDTTQIIPGHGELASRADLVVYRDLLEEVRRRLEDLLAAGMDLDEIVAARPTEEWDATWGQGFLSPERFVRLAARSLQGR